MANDKLQEALPASYRGYATGAVHSRVLEFHGF
jgi:hypothetical protein